MSKATKIWLIMAASLVALGIIILGGVIIALQGDINMLSINKFESNEHKISESFDSIIIDTDTANITFTLSGDGQCKVVCYERKNVRHSVTVTDGKLTVKSVDTRRWYERIGISFEAPSVTVYLPQAQYSSLSINEDTGDVYIPHNLSFADIDVKTSTGDIECYASASGKMKIKASTGNIKIDGVSAKDIELSVSTGNITASSVTCEGNINITVSTGNTELTDITCKDLVSNGSTGKLTIKRVIASGCFSIERSTGDIRIESCDAGEITIMTDTGDVTGTLLSDKIFITNTDTGKKDVPNTTTGGRCKITTDTGDIKIKIVE